MNCIGPLVAIVGPTASGKSSIADLVALELGTDVISVDAMQVYKGMDLGTAKTPVSERLVPLRMVDVCDPTEDYSVQIFQRDCRDVVDSLLLTGKTPVLCGGTGLYLNAVIDEMVFPRGEKGDEHRSAYETLADELGAEGLHLLLEERDPASAALIHPHNVRRVVRALEMLDEGKSYAEHNKGLKTRSPHYEARIWGLTMDRSCLYSRIEQRVDHMIQQGLVDEVASLLDKGLVRESTAGQAIGYKELIEYLSGNCSLDEAVDAIKARTRRYAKRQISWFKNDGRVRWLDMDTLSVQEARDVILGNLNDGGEKGAC